MGNIEPSWLKRLKEIEQDFVIPLPVLEDLSDADLVIARHLWQDLRQPRYPIEREGPSWGAAAHY